MNNKLVFIRYFNRLIPAPIIFDTTISICKPYFKMNKGFECTFPLFFSPHCNGVASSSAL
uniref:Uncharacterized protein n=1 Tax=Anguilla anguilla TaxID=7936 RepID=A0A0E9XAR6_ANGAN